MRDVGPTSKSFFGSCEDHCTDGIILVSISEDLVELLEEGGAESIESLWSVESDLDDGGFRARYEKVLVCFLVVVGH